MLVGKGIARVTISAKVFRKDGKVEDLGVVAQYTRSPWMRFINWLGKVIKHG